MGRNGFVLYLEVFCCTIQANHGKLPLVSIIVQPTGKLACWRLRQLESEFNIVHPAGKSDKDAYVLLSLKSNGDDCTSLNYRVSVFTVSLKYSACVPLTETSMLKANKEGNGLSVHLTLKVCTKAGIKTNDKAKHRHFLPFLTDIVSARPSPPPFHPWGDKNPVSTWSPHEC